MPVGIVGTTINATTTGQTAGLLVMAGPVNADEQSIVNDLATISAGAVTLAGVKTFAAAPIFAAGAHVSQGQALTADGTGAMLTGAWELDGALFSVCPQLESGPQKSITGATNATPIVLTVAAHGLVAGQQVAVASVGGNTAANGTWVANVLSSSTFGLVGSVGNGAYTAATGNIKETVGLKFTAPRTVTRILTNLWNDGNQFTGSGWGAQVPGVFLSFIADATSAAQKFGYEIDVPHGASISSATIYMRPPGGHGGFPGMKPATFPQVDVYRYVPATGVTTTLATQVDPNNTVVAYESYTAITATLGTPEIADRSMGRYFVILSTETGANALSGTSIFGGSVTYATSFLEQV